MFTGEIAATADAVWALTAAEGYPWVRSGFALARIDAGTNAVVASIGLEVNGFMPVLAAGGGAVWVSGGMSGTGTDSKLAPCPSS